MTTNATAGGARITAGRAPRTYLLELIVNHTDPTAETRVSYFIQSRPTADAPWQPHGLRASWASKEKGMERLASRREMQPTWEHRLMVRTTTVIEVLDAVVSPPPSRAELRDHIRRAICEAEGFAWDTDMLEPDEYGDVADAVLAVLPVQDDRAAVLLWAADAIDAETQQLKNDGVLESDKFRPCRDASAQLRRLAVEAQNTATAEHHTVDGTRYLCHTDDHYCPSEARPAGTQQPARGDQFEAWLKAQRDEYEVESGPQWMALDEVLDTYRLHADTGTPLGEHVCEGQTVGDCECLKPHLTPSGNVRVDHLLRRQTGEPAPVAQQPAFPCAAPPCRHPHSIECGNGCQAAEQQPAAADDEETPSRAVLLDLVRDFLDPDPCSFDHHGYCQAHGWLGGEPGSCPHGRTRKLIPGIDEDATP